MRINIVMCEFCILVINLKGLAEYNQPELGLSSAAYSSSEYSIEVLAD